MLSCKKTFTIYSPDEIEHLKYHTFVLDLVNYHTWPSLTSCVSHTQFSTISYVQVCSFELLVCHTFDFWLLICRKLLFFWILANLFHPHLLFVQLKCHIWGLGAVQNYSLRISQDSPQCIIHCRTHTPSLRTHTPTTTMPPRASRKTLPPAAASESHLSAGHKHKKSAPKNKNSKKKDEKESNKSNKKGDKAIGMRKSPPKSSGYESDEHCGCIINSLLPILWPKLQV